MKGFGCTTDLCSTKSSLASLTPRIHLKNIVKRKLCSNNTTTSLPFVYPVSHVCKETQKMCHLCKIIKYLSEKIF